MAETSKLCEMEHKMTDQRSSTNAYDKIFVLERLLSLALAQMLT